MYFDFEDDRPDTPTIARPLSSREGVFLSIIIHLLAVIVLLVGPRLPWVRAMEERRLQALEEQRRKEVERQREQARFVFVKPRLDVTSPKPVPRADLSDLDRKSRTVERAEKPTNPLPFARGNSPEFMEATPPSNTRKPSPEPAPPNGEGEPGKPAVTPPEAECWSGCRMLASDAA